MSCAEKAHLEECGNCPQLGACCYFHAPLQLHGLKGYVFVYSTIPCPHLGDDGLCTRYETRHEVPWCGRVEQAGTRWPTFCPHSSDTNYAVRPEQLRERGMGKRQVRQLQARVDGMVRARIASVFKLTPTAD